MERIPIQEAEIYYDKNFLSPEAATTLFNVLPSKLPKVTTPGGATYSFTYVCSKELRSRGRWR